MRFVIATYGTEGDVRPLSALARTLMAAGHDVLLMADRATLGTAERAGIPVLALSGDIRGSVDAGTSITNVVARDQRVGDMAKALAGIANASANAWMREILAAARGSDALIVSGLAAFIGLSAAERLGIPGIGASFIPMTETAAFPSPFLPPRSVPGFANRLSHRFVNAMIWRSFRRATEAARFEICGLPPRRQGWTRHPILYGVSPSLVPRPADWPANARICGQWRLPEPEYSPPESLLTFLSAGEAPLYVGFGSMVGFDRGKLLDSVVTAVQGRRALFNPGWGGIDRPLPPNFHVIGDTPHDWLFPKVSIAVHHGGSGTSHSAARAGVPSVVVGFAGDQAFWGDRLQRAGVAPRPLNGHRLDARDLAQRLQEADTASMRQRAAELRERMRPEQGLATAVHEIERILAGA